MLTTLIDLGTKLAYYNHGSILIGLALVFYPSLRLRSLQIAFLTKVILFLSLASMLTMVFRYLIFPNYIDHIEPSLVIEGKLLSEGINYFEFRDSTPFPIGVYGPLVPITQAIFGEFFGWSILVSKLPSVLIAVFAILMLLTQLKKGAVSTSLLLIILSFGFYIFWVRSDSYILATVIISVCALKQGYRSYSVFALLGFMCSIATLGKVHAILYYLLILISPFARREMIDAGYKKCLTIFALVFVFFTLFIFIVTLTNPIDYFFFITMTLHHGIDLKLLLNNALYLTVLLLAFLTFHKFDPIIGTRKSTLIIPISVFATILLIASKPGAGAQHILPAIVIFYGLYGVAHHQINLGNTLISLILCFLSIANSYSVIMSTNGHEREKYSLASDELKKFDKEFRGLFMVPSGDATYSFTYLKPLLSKSVQFDVPGLMELEKANFASSGKLIGLLKNCQWGYIILPSEGNPLEMSNWYDQKALIDIAVNKAFTEKYTLLRKSDYWRVYSCNGNS